VKKTRKIRRPTRPALAPVSAWIFAALSLAPPFRASSQAPQAAPIAFPVASPTPPAETRIFPLSEVRRGETGVAYTVFEGVNPEPMNVEILGLLKNSLGPGQDMILARLHGSKPEYTGVVAGMSGSPVYIGGRLVGALSYRIGQFSKDPIAGITPIEQMFEVRDRAPAATVSKASTGSPQIAPIETPLVVTGVSPDTLQLLTGSFGDGFRSLGMTPLAGLGGADDASPQPEPIIPGSAVSAVLVRGDMSMAATCTVTYVDPTRLLACGHPFTQYGAVDIPMTKTSVVATLASPLNAFKIVNTTETVGSFTEDRSSAILGIFGRKSRMIPVSVEVSGRDATGPSAQLPSHTFHYEVLDNPSLTPNAILVSIYQSLHGTNRAGEETSYRVAGEMNVKDLPPIQFHALVPPGDLQPAAIAVALYINESFSRIYGNTAERPTLTGLHLHIEAIPDRRSAVLESATLSRSDAHPGDTVEIQATLRPYQGAARTVTLPVHLPDTLAPGPVRIVIADNATLDRLTQPAARPVDRAPDLADTIAALNRLHPNDRLFAAVLDHVPQAVLEGGTLPELPISMANVFEPLKQTQKLQLNGESVLATASTETGYALSGSQVVTLTIR
jgi:hypothetical protein